MQVYRVTFVPAKHSSLHTTCIHAASTADALRKLAERFPREIHVESIDEDRGRFILGSEERDFSA